MATQGHRHGHRGTIVSQVKTYQSVSQSVKTWLTIMVCAHDHGLCVIARLAHDHGLCVIARMELRGFAVNLD